MWRPAVHAGAAGRCSAGISGEESLPSVTGPEMSPQGRPPGAQGPRREWTSGEEAGAGPGVGFDSSSLVTPSISGHTWTSRTKSSEPDTRLEAALPVRPTVSQEST